MTHTLSTLYRIPILDVGDPQHRAIAFPYVAADTSAIGPCDLKGVLRGSSLDRMDPHRDLVPGMLGLSDMGRAPAHRLGDICFECTEAVGDVQLEVRAHGVWY